MMQSRSASIVSSSLTASLSSIGSKLSLHSIKTRQKWWYINGETVQSQRLRFSIQIGLPTLPALFTFIYLLFNLIYITQDLKAYHSVRSEVEHVALYFGKFQESRIVGLFNISAGYNDTKTIQDDVINVNLLEALLEEYSQNTTFNCQQNAENIERIQEVYKELYNISVGYHVWMEKNHHVLGQTLAEEYIIHCSLLMDALLLTVRTMLHFTCNNTGQDTTSESVHHAYYRIMIRNLLNSQNDLVLNTLTMNTSFIPTFLAYMSSSMANTIINVIKLSKEHLQVAEASEIQSLVLVLLFILVELPVICLVCLNARTTSSSMAALQTLFNERIGDLKKEKRRTEMILGQMLPKTILRSLRSGREVKAESYKSATVLFSDVERFDVISTRSEASEIVTLLNNVYNLLDNLMECHDVYKVETIGAVYMVVSGVPVRNGRDHACEIADLALGMHDATSRISVTCLDDERLTLRIGAHTGPLVAGVVGNKMPRYCLFGDTVNTASRMMSTGQASRVHISHSMNSILEETGRYKTSSRGFIQVKGKGRMQTFWLEGEKFATELDPNLYRKATVRLEVPIGGSVFD